MRYKIEYLAVAVVVHTKTPFGAIITDVATEARKGGATAKTLFGANSFRIRDMNDAGKIVASEMIA
jgi:hypothetical protein